MEKVLIEFFATWCGPCQTMAPIMEEIERRKSGQWKILRIDIDKNPQIAAQFGIRSVPSFLLFVAGEEKWRRAGIITARELENVLEKEFG